MAQLADESEAAFSRAFKRFVGISLGAVRRREPRALPYAAVSPNHGWIFSCFSSIPTNCSIRRARVSTLFAV